MTYQGMTLTLGLLVFLTFGACERQGPPPKAVGSATNKHVEESPAPPSSLDGNAMIQKMKTPMEKARQVEDLVKEQADRTRAQIDQTTP